VPLDPQVLKQVALFASLDDKEAAKIAPLFKDRSYNAGDVIAEEGKHGVGFFIIASGTATVNEGGKERKSLGPGSYFGEIALIDDGARTATVTAETDVEAHVLVAWDFRPLVKEDPDLAWALLEGLARLLRTTTG
jgi:CRP-like cAMP-binding protein